MTSRPARSICIALALLLSPWAWGGPPAAGQDDPRRLIDEPDERNLLGYGTAGIPEGEVEAPSLGSTSNLGEATEDRTAHEDMPRLRSTPAEGAEAATTGRPTGDTAAPAAGGHGVSDAQPRKLVDEPDERNLLGYGTLGIPEGPVENPSLGSTSNLGLPESETPADAPPDTDTESTEP